MNDAQYAQLKAAGFPMKDHMRTSVRLSEDESKYCLNAIELGKPRNPEIVKRYAEVAAKHGLPPLPEGFRYGSGSSRILNIFHGLLYGKEQMRTLTDHIVSGDQAVQLTIHVTDDPGAGGANHHYHIDWLNDQAWRNELPNSLDIHFQEGPIKEAGVNGITQEALLAIVIDRLKSFQAGPYACEENGNALQSCQDALNALRSRTLKRINRGVEGTHEK